MPFKPVDQAIKVILGPCIDDTDFKTREEALTYNQAGMEIDVILEKHDGTVTTTAVTPTTGGVHDWAHTDQGYYELEIPATGGNYANTEEGALTVVGYCTGVLPFKSVTYDIVPQKVWNSLIEGSDNLEVDTIQVSGTAQTANDNSADINAILTDTGTTLDNHLTDIKGTGFVKDTHSLIDIETFVDCLPASLNDPAASAIADAVWDEAKSGHTGAGSFGEEVQSHATPAEVDTECDEALTNYDPPTKAEMDAGFAGLNDPTAASVADAVWDEATTNHTTSGTFGEQCKTDIDAILTDTGTTLDGKITTVDTVVDGIQTDLDNATDGLGALKALIDALNDLSAAQVNAQVVDALNTDTYAEPGQGAPAATASLITKVGHLYKAWRNKVLTTATQISVYNDAGDTVDTKSTISDDATTFTKGEYATGP